jgi:hypothetical protein
MGLLDESAQSAVEAMINESFADDPAVDQSMESDISSDDAEDVKQEAMGEGEADADSQGDSSPGIEASESADEQPSNAQDGPPDTIPYARFREENHRYREMQTQNSELQKKLDAMQQQIDRAQSATPPAEDDIFGLNDVYGEQQQPDKYSALEQRLVAFEEQAKLAEGEKLLDSKMLEIQAEYPDVPEDVLYQAVIDHKSLDAMKVYADRYRSMVTHYKQAGIDEYKTSQAQETQPHNAAPRVPRSSNDSLNIDSGPEPTMDSARESMARMLRQEGFFDS